jgi:hypothetical protein
MSSSNIFILPQAGCIYGLFVPHPESAPVVGLCVVVYFLLMTVLNAHAMFFDSKLALYATHKEVCRHLGLRSPRSSKPTFLL